MLAAAMIFSNIKIAKTLNAIAIIYSILAIVYENVNDLWLESSAYAFTISYIAMLLTVQCFLYLSNDKTVFDKIEFDELEIDFDSIFKAPAYLKLADEYDGNYNSIDFNIFYKAIIENDFVTILERKYYGKDFAFEFVKYLNNLCQVCDENSITGIGYIKDDIEVLYSLGCDDYRFKNLYFKLIESIYFNKVYDEKFTIDISKQSDFPYNLLSNFQERHFKLDGVEIYSIESFLQALKYKDTSKQKSVCKLTAKEANQAGNKLLCKLRKSLGVYYWNNNRIKRNSQEYDTLISRAYDAMASSNPDFITVLSETYPFKLSYKIGKQSKHQTALTESEFVSQLYRLRDGENNNG
jgi:hypothetical protein